MSIDTAQHKSILVRILKDIFTDKAIAPFLGFKGGTAALLFYNLPRFSVDLDFDLLNDGKATLVFDHVKTLLEKYGIVKQAEQKRYTIFFLLAYNEKRSDAQNIKVEINKRNFGSSYEVRHYLGIPMQVMVQQDIIAHKLVAMIERIGKANRDIFDSWFFLDQNWPINKSIIELRAHVSYKDFLSNAITVLEKMNNRNILSGLGELVDAKQKAWVKTHLKEEILFLLRLLHAQQLS
ncbi:nucleotidyl transferase AbiEii/AbiGii toxin family protein [Candidatus Dependentiae bacterium]|nr:nucleotidyl transferase AbiEii/AbiGii toxin family protein [Candidatus Dependentiae bacterium]